MYFRGCKLEKAEISLNTYCKILVCNTKKLWKGPQYIFITNYHVRKRQRVLGSRLLFVKRKLSSRVRHVLLNVQENVILLLLNYTIFVIFLMLKVNLNYFFSCVKVVPARDQKGCCYQTRMISIKTRYVLVYLAH